MKYLFFDLEYANGLGGFVCEFGYVITDEQFNFIEEGDIPISPGDNTRFNLGKKKDGTREIELAYSDEYYKSCKKFPKFYDFIKSLICDEETVPIAFSSVNDIWNLFLACKRYQLEPYDYFCFDVQKFVSNHLKTGRVMSLKSSFDQIVGDEVNENIREHYSLDDAKMTAYIFKYICESENIGSFEYLKRYSSTKIDAIGYSLYQLNKKELNDRFKSTKKFKTLEAKKTKNVQKLKEKKLLNKKSSKLKIYFNKKRNKVETYKGIMKIISLNRFQRCSKMSMADLIVVENEEIRMQAEKIENGTYRDKILTVEEFLKIYDNAIKY